MKKISLKLIIFIFVILVFTIVPNKNWAVDSTTESVKTGDVNGDGRIDSSDLLVILRHMYTVSNNDHLDWQLAESKYTAADANKDNKIDSSDLLVILRYIAAKSDSEIAEKHRNWLILDETEKNQETEVIESKTEQIPVTNIKLNHTDIKMYKDNSFTLTGYISPTNATNKKVRWRVSNSNIASIESTGNGNSIKVTGKEIGTTTITATIENTNIVATCKVTVIEQKTKEPQVTVSKVKITGSTLVYVGDVIGLKSTVTYSNGETSNGNVTWSSSDTNIATVNSKTGEVKGIKAGTVRIKATSGGRTAAQKITVKNKEIPVTSIKLNHTDIKMYKDKSFTLTGYISPTNATNKAIRWRVSNSNIASIESTGNGNSIKVTGKGIGTTTITATVENTNITATCKVTVIEQKTKEPQVTVSKVKITGSTSVYVGDVIGLKSTVTYSNGETSNSNVTWSSSDTSIATVNSKTGEVKGIKAGTVRIKATSGGKTTAQKITVKNKAVSASSIKLNYASVSMERGNTLTLIATILPVNATNQTVRWRIENSKIASIESTGNGNSVKVTGKGVGTTTITATVENTNLVAACKVTIVAPYVAPTIITVKDVKIEGITSLYVGNEATLKARATYSNGTTITSNATWSSGNTSIATVDSKTGKVKALRAGTVKIRATVGGKTATHTLTVKSIPVTKLNIYYLESRKKSTKTSYDLKYNKTLKLYVDVVPTNASYDKIIWKSSNPTYVTVSDSGLVKTVKQLPLIHINNQKTTITATVGGKTATFTIYPKR